MPIPYPELSDLLDDLVASARAILADDLFGFYVVGSFAVGDADLQSDCDFIAVTRRLLTSGQESQLRALHADIPTRNGLWTKNLEGSYAPLDDLGTLDSLGRHWLYIDRGTMGCVNNALLASMTAAREPRRSVMYEERHPWASSPAPTRR